MSACSPKIRAQLAAWQEEEFQKFQARLLPSLDPHTILGVRTPALRAYARRLAKSAEGRLFRQELPHRYFEENQLHAFLIGDLKDFEEAVREVEEFLPHINNWATCDQLRPAVFKTHKKELLPYIRRWLADPHPYTLRFGMEMLMCFYLEDAFCPEYLEWVARVPAGEYYVKMMAAWFFATALALQYAAALPWLEQRRLNPWVHSKTIQKATESYRISPQQKAYLRSLK